MGGKKTKSNSLIGKVYSYFVNINVIVTFKNKKRRKKHSNIYYSFFSLMWIKITLIAWSPENFSICKWYTNAHINTEVCAENSWRD